MNEDESVHHTRWENASTTVNLEDRPDRRGTRPEPGGIRIRATRVQWSSNEEYKRERLRYRPTDYENGDTFENARRA